MTNDGTEQTKQAVFLRLPAAIRRGKSIITFFFFESFWSLPTRKGVVSSESQDSCCASKPSGASECARASHNYY